MDVAIIFTKLKLKFHEKEDSDFVPYHAKCLLENLEKDQQMNARVFLSEIRYFYEKWESCLDVHRDAYEGVTPHLWMNSSQNLSWPLV